MQSRLSIASSAAFAVLILSSSPARADDTSASLQSFQLTDAEIAQKCAASIAARAGGSTGATTPCETVYQTLRDKAAAYQAEESGLAQALTQQGAKVCGSNSDQATCLGAGSNLNQTSAAAHRQLAGTAHQLASDVNDLYLAAGKP